MNQPALIKTDDLLEWADCKQPARLKRATAWFVAPRLILKNQSTSTLFRGKKSLLRPISINGLAGFCGAAISDLSAYIVCLNPYKVWFNPAPTGDK